MFSFRLLLASILLVSFCVNAAPLRKRNVPIVTVPLKRIHSLRSDLPNDLQHQQHVNRGHRRHARMTGRAEPNEAELVANLHARAISRRSAEAREALAPIEHELWKRYSRVGTNAADTSKKDWKSLDGIAGINAAAAQAGSKPGTKATATGAAAEENLNANGFSQGSLDRFQKGGLTKANNPTTKNTLGLDVESNDVGYIATFQIGTPPRDFKLLTDSGSADTWVGGEQCVNGDIPGANCGNHTFLGIKSSSSFVNTGNTFQVTYGAGAVAGTKVIDNFNIAGLKLAAHTFGAATIESNEFARGTTTFDGLMGLAQSSLSNQRVLTPPEALKKAGLINSATTSYRISRLADGLNDGQISFGGIDENTIDPSTLVTVDNVSKIGFWEAAMTLTIDGKDSGLTGRTAILDTGTTLIIAPPADALAVHRQIPGAKSDGTGSFTIPCTTSASLALRFGGRSFAIDARDLLFAPVTNDLKGDCISAISAGTIGTDTEWLIGDTFLKNVVFAHNADNNKITLAVPKTAAATSGSKASGGTVGSNSTVKSGNSAQATGNTKAANQASVTTVTVIVTEKAAGAANTAAAIGPATVTVTVTAGSSSAAETTTPIAESKPTTSISTGGASVSATLASSQNTVSGSSTSITVQSAAPAGVKNGAPGTTTVTTTTIVTVKTSSSVLSAATSK